jgi:hypothetical protein
MYTLSLQVFPAPQELPQGASIVIRPDSNGEEGPCDICGGTGKLFSRQVPCHKCGGEGKGRWIKAMRWILEPRELERARGWAQENKPIRFDTTIRLCEAGGGYTNTGRTTVVCGMHGEKLPSVHGRAHACGEHAVFWVHVALVVHYGHHRGVGSGEVEYISTDPTQPCRLGIVRHTLWRFQDGEDPEFIGSPDLSWIKFPALAVDAAYRKARNYHCRSAFYADGRYAAGPSGALRGAGTAFGGLPSPLKGPGIGYDPTGR